MEREVERVLSKFTGLRRTLEGGVGEQLAALTALQQQLEEGEEGGGMTEQQLAAARATLSAVSGGVARIASEHRDLHCSVSKVSSSRFNCMCQLVLYDMPRWGRRLTETSLTTGTALHERTCSGGRRGRGC